MVLRTKRRNSLLKRFGKKFLNLETPRLLQRKLRMKLVLILVPGL